MWKDLLFALVLKVIEASVGPDDVDGAYQKAKEALEGLVAKTETKIDDQTLTAVLALITGDAFYKVVVAVLGVAGALAQLTATLKDDQVVAALKKAITAKIAARAAAAAGA